MAGRSEARRFVLQMLYLFDQNPDSDRDRVQLQLQDEFAEGPVRTFAMNLLDGVLKELQTLDQSISATASNWRLSRMAPTDRGVLRMGLYEMLYLGTPPAVVINEAIEIAREFGTEHSGGFVNGILDRLKPTAAGSAE